MNEKVVLVVEDDPIIRLTTQKQLSVLGYTCVTIATGEEAVAADHSKFSLIFMDIGLPGIDGTHATLLIRERELREGRRRIPIVALTAHSDRSRCAGAGMDDFLQKPALLDDLRGVIAKYMS